MSRLTGLGIEAKELPITGGGRSASMRQIVADIFGLAAIGFKVAEGSPLVLPFRRAGIIVQTQGEPLQLEKV